MDNQELKGLLNAADKVLKWSENDSTLIKDFDWGDRTLTRKDRLEMRTISLVSIARDSLKDAIRLIDELEGLND